jgi:signal transduction histidine kinase
LIFVVKIQASALPPDDMPRLFEKFYRGKQREARAQPGSGLGLAIVQSIAMKTTAAASGWIVSLAKAVPSICKSRWFTQPVKSTSPRKKYYCGFGL